MNASGIAVERALKQLSTTPADPKVQAFIRSNIGLSEQELLKGNIAQALQLAAAELPTEWKTLQGKYGAGQITQTDVDATAGALKAVILGCSGSSGEVARAALVASFMEFSHPDLFKLLEPHFSVSANVATWSLQVVQKFHTKMEVSPNAPVYERDAFAQFQKAVKEQNFFGISKFIDMLNRGIGSPRHAILEKVTCLAAKANLAAFSTRMDECVRTDFIAMHVALCALSADLLIKVATAAQSHLVKLSALKLLVDNRPYYKTAFAPTGISALIQTLLPDPVGWPTFCKFFGEFPTRTPSLWQPVGIALYGASSSSIVTLINNFNTGRHNPHPDEYSQILVGLAMEPSPQPALNAFLVSTEAKWRDHFRLRRRSPDDTTADLEITNFYGVMLNSVILRWSLLRLKRHIRRYVQCIGQIHERWFQSELEMISYVALAASQLLPYLEAYSHLSAPSPDPAFESEISASIDHYFGYFYSDLWNEAERYAIETKKML